MKMRAGKNFSMCIAALFVTVLFFQTAVFAQFQNMKPVDVNGDGRKDLIDVCNRNGNTEIRVRFSTRNGFVSEDRTGEGQGVYRESFNWFAGDFDGDGKTDIGNVRAEEGQMKAEVHMNTGAGFSVQPQADAQGEFKYNQRWFAGDYTGDGKDDLLKLWNDGGSVSLDLHETEDGLFSRVRKVTQTGKYSPSDCFFSGDFNGDGALDILRVFEDEGACSFAMICGKSFEVKSCAVKQGVFDRRDKWLIGDFNGDGKNDLARVRGEGFDIHQGGKTRIEVHVSDGESFELQTWGEGLGDFGRDCDYRHFAAGDFDGDGDDDIVQLWNDGGKLSVDIYRSGGTGFSRESLLTKTGDWFRKKRWLASDFTGDGIMDLGAVWDNAGTIVFEVFVSNGRALLYEVWGQEPETGYYDRRWFGGVIESDNSSADKICVSVPAAEVNQIQAVINDGLDIYL
ncbi:MAG: VCBS repeat-containing protein, partial [Pontiellaceae bacterium]|nr:VCBS repeat-containing protein [Pontiellaceae bacterium]